MADQDKQALMVTSLAEEQSAREADLNGLHESAVEPDASAIAAAARFVRTYWTRVCFLSVILLIPCFWHRHIEAGDLASHTYNAWLAQLVDRGQAPGLWLARQWNNIFFDILLLRLGNLIGLNFAEKIAVCLSVLIFFWGAFALVVAMTRRIPWFLVPCVMIFAYGWTFQMGFLNYYISLGLAFFGMALAERGTGWQLSILLALVPLTWMAHPLGVVLLIGGSTYLILAKRLAHRGPWLLGAAGALSGFHFPLYFRALRSYLGQCLFLRLSAQFQRGRSTRSLLCAVYASFELVACFHPGLPGIGYRHPAKNLRTVGAIPCSLAGLYT